MNTTDLKNELYDRLKPAFEPNLTKEEVSFIVETLLDTMLDNIITDGKIIFRGFGGLHLTKRAGRNYIVRGNTYYAPERNTVTFKPGSTLKRRLTQD